jgi:hypothetical protein
MAAAPRLPKNLRDALGPDGAEDLVTILEHMREQHAELRREIRSDFAEFRREMRADLDGLEARLNVRFEKNDDRFAVLERKIANVKSDLMKWSFVFWCGAVTAVAALAGVLRS